MGSAPMRFNSYLIRAAKSKFLFLKNKQRSFLRIHSVFVSREQFDVVSSYVDHCGLVTDWQMAVSPGESSQSDDSGRKVKAKSNALLQLRLLADLRSWIRYTATNPTILMLWI